MTTILVVKKAHGEFWKEEKLYSIFGPYGTIKHIRGDPNKIEMVYISFQNIN